MSHCFTSQIVKECSGDMKWIKAAILKVDKKQILAKSSENARRQWLVCKCSAKLWGTMVRERTQETRLIDHILEKHWKELHLPEISAADLITMLSNSQIEALPKFKRIFNTHALTATCTYSSSPWQCYVFLYLIYVHVFTGLTMILNWIELNIATASVRVWAVIRQCK